MIFEVNFRGGFQLTDIQFRSIRRFRGSVYFRFRSACLQRTVTSRDLVTSRLMTTLSIRRRRTSPACRTSGLAPVVTTSHVPYTYNTEACRTVAIKEALPARLRSRGRERMSATPRIEFGTGYQLRCSIVAMKCGRARAPLSRCRRQSTPNPRTSSPSPVPSPRTAMRQ